MEPEQKRLLNEDTDASISDLRLSGPTIRSCRNRWSPYILLHIILVIIYTIVFVLAVRVYQPVLTTSLHRKPDTKYRPY